MCPPLSHPVTSSTASPCTEGPSLFSPPRSPHFSMPTARPLVPALSLQQSGLGGRPGKGRPTLCASAPGPPRGRAAGASHRRGARSLPEDADEQLQGCLLQLVVESLLPGPPARSPLVQVCAGSQVREVQLLVQLKALDPGEEHRDAERSSCSLRAGWGVAQDGSLCFPGRGVAQDGTCASRVGEELRKGACAPRVEGRLERGLVLPGWRGAQDRGLCFPASGGAQERGLPSPGALTLFGCSEDPAITSGRDH